MRRIMNRPATNQPPEYTITGASPDNVRCSPPLSDGKSNLAPDKFQATDRALGLKPGNRFRRSSRGHPGYEISRFGQSAGELADRAPDIASNPYNFVAFAGPCPWTVSPPHADHSRWDPELHTGWLEVKAEALTPIFVPMGFPFMDSTRDATFREAPRHFFRMKDAEGTERYAIPGSSLKGVIRAGVEALTNGLCGEINRDDYALPIPYRRRVFQAGVLEERVADGWLVRPAAVHYVKPSVQITKGCRYAVRRGFAVPHDRGEYTADDIRPAHGNLLCQPTRFPKNNITGRHNYSWIIVRRCNADLLFLPDTVIETYRKNLTHAHYKRHYEEARDNGDEPYQTLPDDFAKVIEHLAELKEGTLIFYTCANNRITTFGKNINYLWPARRSVEDLAGRFFPPKDGLRGLREPLTLAELMFGFSGKHVEDGSSHPFRGKVRFEALWSEIQACSLEEEKQWPDAQGLSTPPATPGLCLRLAPLTSPRTRAKSRPLYLAWTSPGGRRYSASYEDDGIELMGRKFYWHQKSIHPSGIAAHHLYDDVFHAAVASQCPPPLLALRAGTEFRGRIHFENLSPVELGALIYALEGDGSYDHALKIGKGKPRGLGSVRLRVEKVITVDPVVRYGSLCNDSGATVRDEGFKRECLGAFKSWVARQSGNGASFENLPWLQDYIALHNWACAAVRYYPINFSDYNWLPADNDAKGEARRGVANRPPAMPRARNKPGCASC